MGHVAGLAFDQVFAKDLGRIAADFGFHQKTRKVGARDQFRVAHIAQGTLVGAGDAYGGELLGHVAGALVAPAARGGQALDQLRIARVKPQADDVHRGVGKRDGNLHAAHVGHAERLGRRERAGLPTHFVVVGQGPQVHTIGVGAGGQQFGREGAVGDDGVAVQVGVFVEAHAFHEVDDLVDLGGLRGDVVGSALQVGVGVGGHRFILRVCPHRRSAVGGTRRYPLRVRTSFSRCVPAPLRPRPAAPQDRTMTGKASDAGTLPGPIDPAESDRSLLKSSAINACCMVAKALFFSNTWERVRSAGRGMARQRRRALLQFAPLTENPPCPCPSNPVPPCAPCPP